MTPLLWVLVAIPAARRRSMRHTDRPPVAIARAHARPVTPAPITTTSTSGVGMRPPGLPGRASQREGELSDRHIRFHQEGPSVAIIRQPERQPGGTDIAAITHDGWCDAPCHQLAQSGGEPLALTHRGLHPEHTAAVRNREGH